MCCDFLVKVIALSQKVKVLAPSNHCFVTLSGYVWSFEILSTYGRQE